MTTTGGDDPGDDWSMRTVNALRPMSFRQTEISFDELRTRLASGGLHPGRITVCPPGSQRFGGVQEHVELFEAWNSLLDRPRLRRKRRLYLVLFAAFAVSQLLPILAQMSCPLWPRLALWVLFLCWFLSVTRAVLGHSVGLMVLVAGVILFMPLINIAVVAAVDRKIMKVIRQGQGAEQPSGHEP